MSWHILVMAQNDDLFRVTAGWNMGQRRLYGALLNKLRLDVVWLHCLGELQSSRRYTSRIGKARVSGFVLKNTDTIAICVTSVTLGDGDGWYPGGGSRKPDLTQVESISEARLTQHDRLWRLVHLSGDEIRAPGPVNGASDNGAGNIPAPRDIRGALGTRVFISYSQTVDKSFYSSIRPFSRNTHNAAGFINEEINDHQAEFNLAAIPPQSAIINIHNDVANGITSELLSKEFIHIEHAHKDTYISSVDIGIALNAVGNNTAMRTPLSFLASSIHRPPEVLSGTAEARGQPD